MEKMQKTKPKLDLDTPMLVDVQTPWGRFKNLIRRLRGRPYFYVYKEDDGTYTALLIVPTKKRGG